MTTLNIIPFPRSRAVSGEPAVGRTVPTDPSDARATIATAIASAIATPAGRVPPDESAQFAETVIRTAIRFGKRNGQSLNSLPPQMRKWLLDLCDRSNPTAQVVLDWLNGNRSLLLERPATADGEGA